MSFWEREKKRRTCPKCGNFAFYIRIPSSFTEIWDGIITCRGCRTRFRPKPGIINLLIGIGIMIGYFLFIGKKGFYVSTIFKNILVFAVIILISIAFSKLTKR
jgi:hypothetical protein